MTSDRKKFEGAERGALQFLGEESLLQGGPARQCLVRFQAFEDSFSHTDQFLYDAKKRREKRGSGEEAGKKYGWLLIDDK